MQSLSPFIRGVLPRLSGLVLVLVLLMLPRIALAEDGGVNWARLDLSPQQQDEIGRQENHWQRVYTELYPQIQRDKGELRRLMNAPQASDQQIMEIEKRIQANEQRLRQEATRVFLNKKNQLNPVQRVKLQQIMPD